MWIVNLFLGNTNDNQKRLCSYTCDLMHSLEYWCGVKEQTLSITQGVLTASVKELDNDGLLSIFSPGASFMSEP